MTTFFEHQRSSYKKGYMRNLISLASTDGTLDEIERDLIHKIGKTKGLKDWQINDLLEQDIRDHEVFLPESLGNRMNLLFDFMQIIYADGEVTHSEVSFLKSIVADLNLRPEIVDHMVDLFQYGTPDREEWNDFVEHVSRVFVH